MFKNTLSYLKWLIAPSLIGRVGVGLLLLCLSLETSAQFRINLGKNSPMSKLQYAEMAINNLYVDSVNEDKLVEDAIRGMLKELDPHSSYSTPQEVKALNEPLQGNFDGIGVQFNMIDDTLLVIQPTTKGPSEKVGILAGDRIITVNDTSIAGVKMPRNEIMKRLRGPRGTKVKLGIKRRSVAEMLYFTVTRDKIPVKSIDAVYMIRPGVGYIRIENFGATTYTEFMAGLATLQEQGMESLILDLQENGGGYLEAAVRIANEFLEDNDLIVYTEGNKQKRRDYLADGSGSLKKGRVVVLVNEFSASAAEIVTGAIQDQDRGIVVGRRSFGKGLVQRPIDLPDESMIRLTVAHYYTPSGRCIQKPYKKGELKEYEQDFENRLKHGELTNRDSIHFSDSLRYETLRKHRTVYGGGGIMPDVFVPVDTTRASAFYIACNRKTTQMRFAAAMFDKYAKQVLPIDNYADMDAFLARIDIPGQFRKFALQRDGITVSDAEYAETLPYLQPQLNALVARYSKLNENAFYKYYLPVDTTVEAALKSIRE